MAATAETESARRGAAIRTEVPANCYLCGSEGRLLHADLTDSLFGVSGAWSFSRCSNDACRLVWLSPRPTKDDNWHAYVSYYTHGAALSEPIVTNASLRKAYSFLLRSLGIWSERKNIDRMYLTGTSAGRLLEIGCGDGNRLALLREMGWSVEGLEIDAKAAQIARSRHNLKVHISRLEDLRLPADSFDAVVMNHVVEHLYDPVALLKECRRILVPQGTVVAVTPNIESIGYKIFGENWRGLEPPRHLHLFSPATLLATAKAAGFEKPETWTTAANALAIATGSVEVFRRKRKWSFRGKRLMTGAFSLLFQLFASAYRLFSKGSGEECVLFARK